MKKIPIKTCKFISLLLITIIIIMNGFHVHSVSAASDFQPYKNPEDIIIASPRTGYTTTSNKVSILGACDYRFPLYMNGEKVNVTNHGFFTEYVSLKVGENIFVFENNDKVLEYRIVRKKVQSTEKTSSDNNTKSKVTYTEYKNDTYGVITSKYAMPRSNINGSDVNLKPLTRGTACILLGQEGNYYKLEDGTYVAKSSISKHTKLLENNVVSTAKLSYKQSTNQLVTELTMNINTLYHVTIEKSEIKLTLYHTSSGSSIKTPQNDTIKKVTKITDTIANTVTYCFELYNNKMIYGYDILFNHGVMKFEMKVAPYIDKKGSLEGITVFLDAGHGDTDSGALGPMGTYGPMEKDMNLNITLYARKYLEQLGANVILSREDDTFLSLSDRVSMIRNLRPDISVSIHGNSLDNSSNYSAASGFLTYYSYANDIDVPSLINRSISNQMGFKVRDTRQKSLSLTRFTTCPGVLLETKFLSNPLDYEYLIDTKNQEAFGKAIAYSILEYFESIAIYPTVYYEVKRGDSLLAIAKKYKTTVKKIADYNHIKNINYIYIGQILTIPK